MYVNRKCKFEWSSRKLFQDDDLQVRIKVSKEVGCIPVYWDRIMPPTLAHKTCETKNDMERTWNLLQNFSQIHSTYHLPCNEMKLTVTYDQQKLDNHWGPLLTDAGNPLSPKVDDVLSIESRYLDPNYQWKRIGKRKPLINCWWHRWHFCWNIIVSSTKPCW